MSGRHLLRNHLKRAGTLGHRVVEMTDADMIPEVPTGAPFSEPLGPEPHPFEHGVISLREEGSQRLLGHRIIRRGVSIGWLASSDEGTLLGGRQAAEVLDGMESVRSEASIWSLTELAAVVTLLPEALEDLRELDDLMPTATLARRILAKDLVAAVEAIGNATGALGALAFEQGITIASAGTPPGNEDEIAREASEELAARAFSGQSMGLESVERTVLHGRENSLMLLGSASRGLAVWMEPGASQPFILSAAARELEEHSDRTMAASDELPDVFALRDVKGGTDRLIALLGTAVEQEVTGTIVAEDGTTLMLSEGIPVALRTEPEDVTLEEAVRGLTSASGRLKLGRFPPGTACDDQSGTVEGFDLEALTHLISTVRTRSEARVLVHQERLRERFGFATELRRLARARTAFDFAPRPDGTPAKLPIGSPGDLTVISDLRRRVDELVDQEADLSRSLERATSRAIELESRLVIANEARDGMEQRLQEARTNQGQASTELEASRAAAGRSNERVEEAEARASRLAKRVSWLEHQLSERAGELAKALGEANAARELRDEIRDLGSEEARSKAELDHAVKRLADVRTAIDRADRQKQDLERELVVLTDRNEQLRNQVAELDAKRLTAERVLEEMEHDARAARRRADTDTARSEEEERRRTNLHSELRELLEERRNLLREIGDLSAERGRTESNLRGLMERASSLTDAHETALEDIRTAEVLRARMSEEPLAQALLSGSASFEGLGPILQRLDHARSLGYSVRLLDRAVERCLQLIQQSVDHVAATPRHLLSSEVLALLEHQAPATAGAVRGLTRWSVTQRLEEELGTTVTHLLLDLERMLEDHERAITMLRRLKAVLDQLERLGAGAQEIEALRSQCMRPEALPHLASRTRMLIAEALDRIHLDADLMDAGESARVQGAVHALDDLLDELDRTGMATGAPPGALWSFQREGILPWESTGIPAGQRLPVSEDVLADLQLEPAPMVQEQRPEDGTWIEVGPPEDADDVPEETSPVIQKTTRFDLEQDRVKVEVELARLDAERIVGDPNEFSSFSDIDL